jgi:hypothetical protein
VKLFIYLISYANKKDAIYSKEAFLRFEALFPYDEKSCSQRGLQDTERKP